MFFASYFSLYIISLNENNAFLISIIKDIICPSRMSSKNENYLMKFTFSSLFYSKYYPVILVKATLDKLIKKVSSAATIVAVLGYFVIKAISPKPFPGKNV